MGVVSLVLGIILLVFLMPVFFWIFKKIISLVFGIVTFPVRLLLAGITGIIGCIIFKILFWQSIISLVGGSL